MANCPTAKSPTAENPRAVWKLPNMLLLAVCLLAGLHAAMYEIGRILFFPWEEHAFDRRIKKKHKTHKEHILGT